MAGRYVSLRKNFLKLSINQTGYTGSNLTGLKMSPIVKLNTCMLKNFEYSCMANYKHKHSQDSLLMHDKKVFNLSRLYRCSFEHGRRNSRNPKKTNQ